MSFLRSFFVRKKDLKEIYLFKSFFNNSECEEILRLLKEHSFKTARQFNEGRKNKELFTDDSEIRNLFVKRIKDFRFQEIKVIDYRMSLEFYKYDVGDYIERHTDASMKLNDGNESNFTALIYLNDTYVGGETFFNAKKKEISPEAGSLLLFNHRLDHEALEIKLGTKYIYRSNWCIRPKSKIFFSF